MPRVLIRRSLASAKVIALELQSDLKHQQDLSFSASAFVVGNQNASQHAIPKLDVSYPGICALPRGDRSRSTGPSLDFSTGDVFSPRDSRSAGSTRSIWRTWRNPRRHTPLLLSGGSFGSADRCPDCSGGHRLLQDCTGPRASEYPRHREGRLLALWDRKSRDACAWYSGLPWRIRSVDRRCSSRSLHWMDRHSDQASCSARIRIERSSGDGRGVSIQRSIFERNLSGRVGP